MTFENVISDFENATGLKFLPIGAKSSPLILLKVDRSLQKIIIQSVKSEKILSRSFSELRTVWEELCSKPAVHVDSALEGSGSSRNHPETLFANLPYIEYLFIKNKKHIALMPENTHELGEIREMDTIQAQKVKVAIKSAEMKVGHPTALMVVSDIIQGVTEIEGVCGVRLEAVCGTYAVLSTKSKDGLVLGIEVDGYKLLTPKPYNPSYIFVQQIQ